MSDFSTIPRLALSEKAFGVCKGATPKEYRATRAQTVNELVRAATSDDKHVMVTASPAIGKSTALPSQLAGKWDMRIVVVESSHALVGSVATGIAMQGGTSLVADTAEGLRAELRERRRHVIVCTSATYLEFALSRVQSDWHVLFVDEAHNNDYQTFFLSNYGEYLPFVARSIRATASASLKTKLTAHAKAHPVDVRKVENFEVEDVRAFLEAGQNVLVISDDRAQREELLSASCGEAFSLTRRSSYPEVLSALNAAAKSVGVLVVADTSFRTGFNFRIGVCFDRAGTVETEADDHGNACDVWRYDYTFEVFQARSRVGRSAPGTYIRTAGKEKDAASILAFSQYEHARALIECVGAVCDKTLATVRTTDPAERLEFLASGLPLATFRKDFKPVEAVPDVEVTISERIDTFDLEYSSSQALRLLGRHRDVPTSFRILEGLRPFDYLATDLSQREMNDAPVLCEAKRMASIWKSEDYDFIDPGLFRLVVASFVGSWNASTKAMRERLVFYKALSMDISNLNASGRRERGRLHGSLKADLAQVTTTAMCIRMLYAGVEHISELDSAVDLSVCDRGCWPDPPEVQEYYERDDHCYHNDFQLLTDAGFERQALRSLGVEDIKRIQDGQAEAQNQLVVSSKDRLKASSRSEVRMPQGARFWQAGTRRGASDQGFFRSGLG